MLDFVDAGEQVACLCLSPYEGISRINGYAEPGLMSEENYLPLIPAPISMVSVPY